MATLNLFPARIRFTNDDGTLTPEAYRALQILMERVGGPLGNNGGDTFVSNDFSGTEAQQSAGGDISADVFAGSEAQAMSEMLQQPVSADSAFEMVMQPGSESVNASMLLGATWAAPGSIGAATPAAGAFTLVTADSLKTFTGSASATTGVATAVYTLPNTAPAVYLVSANIGAVGDAANFSSFAVVASDSATARIALSNDGALLAISLVGLIIKVTQNSGVTQTANITITRIG